MGGMLGKAVYYTPSVEEAKYFEDKRVGTSTPHHQPNRTVVVRSCHQRNHAQHADTCTPQDSPEGN